MSKAAIISTVAAFALGAALAWSYQANRHEAQISKIERDNAVILAESHKRAKTDYEHLEKVKNDAINLAYEEAKKDKASAAAASAESERLRGKLASVSRRAEQANRAALEQFATVSAELLGACTKEYQWMAEEAARNAANARLMLNAWPRRD